MKASLFAFLLLALCGGSAFAASASGHPADTYLIDFPSIIRLSVRSTDGVPIARTDIGATVLFLAFPSFALIGAYYAALRRQGYRPAFLVTSALVVTLVLAFVSGSICGSGSRSWVGAIASALVALAITSSADEGRLGNIACMLACMLIGAFESELVGLGMLSGALQYALFVPMAGIVAIAIALIALDMSPHVTRDAP